MRAALLALLVLVAGCRTRPTDGAGGDLALPPAALPDLASATVTSDLGGTCGGTQSCRGDELCVFVNRGDCAMFLCAAVPARCAATPTCDCLGTTLCPSPSPNESFTCLAPSPGVNAQLECRSTLQCV